MFPSNLFMCLSHHGNCIYFNMVGANFKKYGHNKLVYFDTLFVLVEFLKVTTFSFFHYYREPECLSQVRIDRGKPIVHRHASIRTHRYAYVVHPFIHVSVHSLIHTHTYACSYTCWSYTLCSLHPSRHGWDLYSSWRWRRQQPSGHGI